MPPTRTCRCATTSACSAAFLATRCGSQEGEPAFDDRRAHPPDLDTLPPRRGRAGAGASSNRPAQQPVPRPRQPDHPRLQLFLAPRQHRRGPAPDPPHPRPRAGRLARPARAPCAARSPMPSRPGSPGPSSPPSSRRADRAGADRAPDRGAPAQDQIDREMEVAQLLAERDRIRLTPGGAGGERGGACAARFSPCGRPAILRRTRLKVIDEVDERDLVLRLHVSARAAALLRRHRGRARHRPAWNDSSCPRSCAWEAGSAATATAIPSSPARCCARPCDCRAERALTSTLTRSICSAANSRSTAAGQRLGPGSGPRRALAGPLARTARTSPIAAPFPASTRGSPRPPRLRPGEVPRHAIGEAPPYANAAEFVADLDVHPPLPRRERLRDPRPRPPAPAAPGGERVRLPPRRRRPAPEFRRARAHARRALRDGRARHGYVATRRGRARRPPRRRTCRRRGRSPRRISTIRRRDRLRTRHRATGPREAHRRFGPAAVPNYVISKASSSPTSSRSRSCCKEAGLLQPRDQALALNIVPLFETIADLRECPRLMDELFACPPMPRFSIAAAACRR